MTDPELLEANRREYDRGVDPLMVLAVFEPVHQGWWLTNIGGLPVLDFILERLPPRAQVLELCSGLGDGCRYLASRGDCSVTGVELNAAQVQAARARLSAGPEDLARRIHLVEGDVLTWTPPRPFDAAFAIDALMMIRELEAAVAAAWRALRPGGLFACAEIMAGPAITDEDRRYVWEEGAIVNLPTLSGYAGLLERAGFTDVEVRDASDHALAFFRRVGAAVEERKAPLLEAGGEEGYRTWVELAERYGALFEARHLAYGLCTSTRPALTTGLSGGPA
ncbi:MAG TPA: methyltransferase domain-containing protein [Myxococcales bacterium]|nr:methyltransferase domain-containing protein [Myxococcales bacterium]